MSSCDRAVSCGSFEVTVAGRCVKSVPTSHASVGSRLCAGKQVKRHQGLSLKEFPASYWMRHLSLCISNGGFNFSSAQTSPHGLLGFSILMKEFLVSTGVLLLSNSITECCIVDF